MSVFTIHFCHTQYTTDIDFRYYKLPEIADRLQVSWRTVYRWVKSGKLPAYQLGTEWRVSEGDMRRFLEERRNGAR